MSPQKCSCKPKFGHAVYNKTLDSLVFKSIDKPAS